MLGDMRRKASPGRLAVLAGLLFVPLAGCSDILKVEEPQFLTPSGTSVALLVAGAISDFNVGYSGAGNSDRFLSTSSLIADELFSSGTFTTRTATDQRLQFDLQSGNTSDGAYINLQRARRSAVRAFRAIAKAGGGGDPAEMKRLEGLSIVALAEGFCPNIPLSEVDESGGLIFGAPMSETQLFEAAVSNFDQAAGDQAAAVGKGRALTDLGRFSEAAAAVGGVPTSFIFKIEHSSNTSAQENPIFDLQSNGRYSLSDLEGGNGMPFRSSGDPRVPWIEDPNGGFDSSIRLFISERSATRSAPVIVADGIEARLIEAEADLNAGNPAGMIAKLNALRADVGNLMRARIENYDSFVPGPNNPTTTLAPLVDPGTQVGREDLLFSERAFWLLLTGHRLGDLRRLVRLYGRNPETVYPTGAYFKGGFYGTDVNLPLDFDEQNNPLYTIDLCVFTAP